MPTRITSSLSGIFPLHFSYGQRYTTLDGQRQAIRMHHSATPLGHKRSLIVLVAGFDLTPGSRTCTGTPSYALTRFESHCPPHQHESRWEFVPIFEQVGYIGEIRRSHLLEAPAQSRYQAATDELEIRSVTALVSPWSGVK